MARSKLVVGQKSSINDNRATRQGGGVVLVESKFECKDSHLDGNHASSGGALFLTEYEAALHTCTLHGNAAV